MKQGGLSLRIHRDKANSCPVQLHLGPALLPACWPGAAGHSPPRYGRFLRVRRTRENPRLKGRPVIVGSPPDQHAGRRCGELRGATFRVRSACQPDRRQALPQRRLCPAPDGPVPDGIPGDFQLVRQTGHWWNKSRSMRPISMSGTSLCHGHPDPEAALLPPCRWPVSSSAPFVNPAP